ncbi:MAG: TonB-dependent receptor [Thermoanaerobaculia bacterium]|nr:TonB-dependent receptor [Thermoanaerobaculia bacterium]
MKIRVQSQFGGPRAFSSRLAFVLGLALLVTALPVAAQELTGDLRGTVRLADGTAVPGALVTAASPSLQGSRTTTSTATGQWILRNLPPGQYTVTFELEGMATVQSAASVELGQETPVNVTMGVEAQAETIVVSGELPSVLASSEVSTTYSFQEVNNLPIGREPDDIASLSPGLTTNTPNAGQVTISGAFAYDNIFLIDGVDANDNLFGTSSQVYIEDAIADVQVLTSGISAEYGRFSGGVVNVITKSGGNEFSGTLRADLENDDWRNRTPLEEESDTELEDELSEIYSATLGGYVMKDKLWFFASGRDESVSASEALFQTPLSVTESVEEERLGIKGTVNIQDRHQAQVAYTDREATGTRASFGFSATPDTLRTRTDPSELKVARYSGVLTETLFGELQYSEKTFRFLYGHGGGSSNVPGTQAFIDNTPFRDFLGNFNGHYNAPYFDGTDPEDRDNEQISASLSLFLDSASIGSHDLKFGFEDFSSFNTGGNSQSPTDWTIGAQPLTDANGDLVLDANNKLIPTWRTNGQLAAQWLAERGANVELNTQSFYVNDRWQLNDHWSFNLGARYEEITGETNTNIVTVDTDALVPRLGASYDVRGDGKYRFDVTFSQYAGKYSEAQFAENTNVGNPALIVYQYTGPAGQGLDFAPAYDIANNWVPVDADDGTQNVFVDSDINSPVVDEFTLSAGMELARGGFLKAIYTDRSYSEFVEDFLTTETGSTEVVVEGVSAGTFANAFYRNSDQPQRDYRALQVIGRYRLTDNWTVDGNWTHQFENDGNFEGEGTNTPGISSIIGDFPEILDRERHFPVGPLNDFAEDKVRLWTNYNLDLNRAGGINFGLLANYDKGRTFSRTDGVSITSTQQGILNSLGYASGPSTQTLFFNGRGDVEFEDAVTFDLSINYRIPIVKDFQLWLKADVFNIFDEDAQIAGNTAVDGDANGPLDSLGLPTTFTEPANFGTARNNGDFVDPFEYRFTVGFRF